MITCRDFVLNYSELFKFLECRHGVRSVEKLWRHIADSYFEDLKRRMEERGIKGIAEYCAKTFTEEGDLFKIVTDDKAVRVFVDDCSSVRKLAKTHYIKRYPEYCRHCKVMYGHLFDGMGYDFEVDFINNELGKCKMTISKKENIN